MAAEYQNEYGDWEDCVLLACSLNGCKVMIELEDVVGWCSAHLVEEKEEIEK